MSDFFKSRRITTLFILMMLLMLAIPSSFAQVQLDIPIDALFESSNSWMATLAPIFGLSFGIMFAVAIFGYLIKIVRSALK